MVITNMNKIKTVKINGTLINIVNEAIGVAIAYEKHTDFKRKLGITGEVGEILICNQLNMNLVENPLSEGFDAIDKNDLRVQIKTRHSESKTSLKYKGRISSFSKHPFDYALLGLLNHQYCLCEIWRADYNKLKPLLKKLKKRNPNISSFKRIAKRVFPKTV